MVREIEGEARVTLNCNEQGGVTYCNEQNFGSNVCHYDTLFHSFKLVRINSLYWVIDIALKLNVTPRQWNHNIELWEHLPSARSNATPNTWVFSWPLFAAWFTETSRLQAWLFRWENSLQGRARRLFLYMNPMAGNGIRSSKGDLQFIVTSRVVF